MSIYKLSTRQAYHAMMNLLEEEWELNPSQDIGSLLGIIGTGVWDDGSPNDPAIAIRWEEAVRKAILEHPE